MHNKAIIMWKTLWKKVLLFLVGPIHRLVSLMGKSQKHVMINPSPAGLSETEVWLEILYFPSGTARDTC